MRQVAAPRAAPSYRLLYPRLRHSYPGRTAAVKTIHMALGIVAIVMTAGAALLGGWCWWRVRTTAWFWRLLRAGQGAVILEVVVGGMLILLGHKSPGLHTLYGILPLLVSL